jgi:hypothetical protein
MNAGVSSKFVTRGGCTHALGGIIAGILEVSEIGVVHLDNVAILRRGREGEERPGVGVGGREGGVALDGRCGGAI